MTTRRRILTASVIMFIGILPLVLGIIWTLSVIKYAQQHEGEMGGSDAFLMIFVLITTYAFALIVAGASALWSGLLARKNPEFRSRAASAMRLIVALLLGAPLLGYIGILLRFW